MHCVVIAHKFNDIFYALNTPEFKESDKRLLIVIEKGSIKKEHFPFKEYFDRIIKLNISTKLEYFKHIVKFKSFLNNSQKLNYAFISNPIMMLNQKIIKALNVENVILLEDGAMNYYDFIPSKSKIKRTVQFLLGISNQKLYNKVLKTYLIKPSKAIFAFGKLETLIIKRSNVVINESLLAKIKGKKIFVGNDYYKHDYISIENYNLIVNKIIKEFSIDYYLPHVYSSKKEKIKCKKLDLVSESITLEMIAGYIERCEIYSFGSTLNFTCKQINRNIETNFFKCLDFSVQPPEFNLKNSDNIYTVDQNNIIRLS